MASDVLVTICCLLVSFFIGSIPWGVIVSKVFYKRDVRETGSGNIGFTNSMRSMGKVGGGIVFVLDFGKGVLATALAAFFFSRFASGEPVFAAENLSVFLVSGASCAVVLGHIFSPWLGFKGGKGISTGFGSAFLAMSPLGACFMFASFLIVVLVTKHVSAGSVTAAVEFPFVGMFSHPTSPVAFVFSLIVGVLVVWAHRGNLQRLMDHTEAKIGSDKS